MCNGSGQCVECNTDADCGEPDKGCFQGLCLFIECPDGLQNGSETDVDCGGSSCDPCDTDQGCLVASDCFHGDCGANDTCIAPTCNDGIQNQGDYPAGNNGETDVDCGGPCGATCGPNEGCNDDGDCVGGQCAGIGGSCVPNCTDQVQDNAETDVDCGGGACGGCAVGQMCGADSDCVPAAYCQNGTCCDGAGMCGP